MFTLEKKEPEQFLFKIADAEYSVPKLNDLPYTVLEGLADARNAEDGIAVLKWYVSEIFERYAPGCTEGLSFSDMYALLTAYDAACNVGE